MDGGSPAATSSLAATWPLVGRETELTRIAEAMGDEDCRGVVVSAGAGVGKSRLAREAHAAAQRSGALAVWAQATRSSATSRSAPSPGSSPTTSAPTTRWSSCAAAPTRCAPRRAGARSCWASTTPSSSIPSPRRCCCTSRRRRACSSSRPCAAASRCPDAVVSLWKDAGARRLELDRLGDAAVAALVEGALGGPVEQAALRWVAESSQGNALYVHELVLGAVDAGTLAFERGLWRLARRPSVSPSLVELVAHPHGHPERRASARRSSCSRSASPCGVDELIALDERRRRHRRRGPRHGPCRRPGHRRRRAPLASAVRRGRAQRAPACSARASCACAGRPPCRSATRCPPTTRCASPAGCSTRARAIPPALVLDAARPRSSPATPISAPSSRSGPSPTAAGLPATLVLARAHTARKRFEDTESVLAAAQDDVASARRRSGAHDVVLDHLEQRMHALYWGLGRAADARALLSGARALVVRSGPGSAACCRCGSRSPACSTGSSGTVDLLAELLADPDLDAATRRMAEPRYAIALFYVGRSSEVRSARRGACGRRSRSATTTTRSRSAPGR